jgi:hypothetical protein
MRKSGVGATTLNGAYKIPPSCRDGLPVLIPVRDMVIAKAELNMFIIHIDIRNNPTLTAIIFPTYFAF